MADSASTPPDSAPAGKGPVWRRRLLLLLLVLTGYSGLALSPELQRRLGVQGKGIWFLDSYALLAASDAAHQGLDPYEQDPLDVYQRRHSYSRWWYALGPLGLTREDNFLLGGGMVAAFMLSVVLLYAPRNRYELGWYAFLLLSPPVLLAVNRANNDLAVFALLALGLALSRRGAWGPAWLGGAVGLATGLKFYPVAAAGALLGLRPRRRALAWTVIVSVVGLAVLATVWADFRRAVFPAPAGTCLFGSEVLWRTLGWDGPATRVLTAGLLLGGALGLWRSRATAAFGAEDPAPDWQRAAFLCGALLLLVCFVAGISFFYRWIFALLLAPWLWTQAGTAEGIRRRAARTGCVLLAVVMWMDGLYCLIVNTVVAPLRLEQLHRWEAGWNLVSQPVAWLMMCLLAGWLATGLLSHFARPARID